MANGPGLYSDLGKRARDILYKDYQNDHKLTLTTYTSNGQTTSSSVTKMENLFVDAAYQVKSENVTTDIKAGTNSVGLKIVVDEAVPGLKAIISLVLPDHKCNEVELHYLNGYAGLNTSVKLCENPIVNFSGVIGNNVMSVGADIAYETGKGNLTKYNAVVNLTNNDSTTTTTLRLNDKGDTLNLLYHRTVKSLSSTVVGYELSRKFSTKEHKSTIGMQHALDPFTVVKARMDSSGKASALIQHEWRPKSFFTVSGEVDTNAIEKTAKVGMALVLKPQM